MADDLARLTVRIDAETARFDRGMNRSARAFDRAAQSIEARAARLDNRLATTGGRFGRGFGPALQQAGFQIGDFATQVSMGGNALTAFTVQGTQLISMFGPWGAVIGAAGAVVGALAVALWDTDDAAEAATGSAEGAANAVNAIEGAYGAAKTAAENYAQAVKDAAADSSSAASSMVLDARQMFEATQSLLRLSQRQAIPQLTANMQSRLALQARVDELSRPTDLDALVAEEVRNVEASRAIVAPDAGPLSPTMIADIRRRLQGNGALAEAERRRQEALSEAETSLLELDAETKKLSVQVRKASRALATGFEVTPRDAEGGAGGGGGGGGGGGSSRSGTPARMPLAGLTARIEALKQERELIGLTGSALARKTAEIEANRVATAALEKIRAEGREATPEEPAQLRAFIAGYQELTLANYAAEEAVQRQADATAEAARRQDELARGLAQTADRFVNAIQQADSFSDALQRVGIELLNLATQGIAGQGPLGGLLGGIIPGLFGGLGGSFAPSATAGMSVHQGIYAKGGAFMAGREITPFASGGVVTKPTLFPMANGMGLMGEAGPEAILPLRRGTGGKLGVAAAGGGGVRSVSLTMNVDARGSTMTEGQWRKVAREEVQRGIGGLIESHREYPVFR